MKRVRGGRIGGHIDEHASAMAHHFYEAGAAADEAETLRFLTLAADQALGTGAFEQAIESLDRALDRNAPGDAERAQRFLGGAMEISEEIGMPRHVELAQGLLSD